VNAPEILHVALDTLVDNMERVNMPEGEVGVLLEDGMKFVITLKVNPQ